jgi:hypothetical protein
MDFKIISAKVNKKIRLYNIKLPETRIEKIFKPGFRQFYVFLTEKSFRNCGNVKHHLMYFILRNKKTLNIYRISLN